MRERNSRRYDIKNLNDPDVKAVFVAELRSNLVMLHREHADTKRQWSDIKSAFLNTSEMVLGTVSHERK